MINLARLAFATIFIVCSGVTCRDSAPRAPEGAITVQWIRNPRVSLGHIYEYRSDGRIDQKLVEYWFYLSKPQIGDFFFSVSSQDGTATVQYEQDTDEMVPIFRCRKDGPSSTDCTLARPNLEKGAHRVVVTAPRATAYRLFIGAHTMSPL